MVPDLVVKFGGILEFDGKKSFLNLEHQTDGYFTNDRLISQASLTIRKISFDNY